MSAIREQSLWLAGLSTRLRISGQGEDVLVLFPAVMDSGAAFGRVQLLLSRMLAGRVTTIAVDPPGYGDDGLVPPFDAWPGFCAALMSHLEHSYRGRFVLAGNSSGAVAATEAALASERASGLLWICWCDWRLTAARSDELLCPRDTESLTRLLALAWHHPPVLPPETASHMLVAAERNRAHVASFDAEQHRARVARYRGPMLVLAGDSDGLVPEADARATAAARKDARFERIEHSGHYPHREQPKALAQVLASFTEDCLGHTVKAVAQV